MGSALALTALRSPRRRRARRPRRPCARVADARRARCWRRRSCSCTSPTATRCARCATTRRSRWPPRCSALALVAALAVVFRRSPTAFAGRRCRRDPVPDPDLRRRARRRTCCCRCTSWWRRGRCAWAVPRLRPERSVGLADLSRQGGRRAGLARAPRSRSPSSSTPSQSAYAGDVGQALENVVFFYVPFALLFVAAARLEWTPRLARHLPRRARRRSRSRSRRSASSSTRRATCS